jgi:transposase
MSMFRQGSLFDLQELYDLEPTQRFEAVFSTIDIHPLFHKISKISCYGAPVQLDLIKRLKHDYIFRSVDH